MRIRRRAAGAPPPAQARSSPSSLPCCPPAPRAPSPALAPPSGTAGARRVEPLEREVDRTMPEMARFDNGRPSGSGNRQEEEAEERDKGSGKEKKRSGGQEDGRSGYEREQRAVDVVCSKSVVPEREEEQGPVEVEEEENKSEGSRPIEEKTSAAAALCKKGDGKGWHCKRVAQCGYSLCQYHLDKLRSYYSYSQAKKKKKKKMLMMKPKSAPLPEKSTAAGVSHRQGASQQKQKKNGSRVEGQHHALSTGPGVSDSFYYYSGFGPRWGKRSRCRSGDAATTHDGGAAQAAQPSQHSAAAAAAAAPAAEEEEGEDEEGEYECDSTGRDGRPWKSRALSSLL